MIKKLLWLMKRKDRFFLLGLLAMVVLMALIDAFGVASILPFIAVLVNPNLVHENLFLHSIFVASGQFGIGTTQGFLFFLGLFVFFILLVSMTLKSITIYLLARFAFMMEYSIGRRLIEGYLHQSYDWFLSRHSADIGKTILSEVGLVIREVMAPAISLFTQATVALALVILLIIVDPQLAFLIVSTLAIIFALTFKATRGLLDRIGKDCVAANQGRFRAVSEAFASAKVVKLGGFEGFYAESFSKPAEAFARHQSTAYIFSVLPRFAFEGIAFGGILLVILYLMVQRGGFAEVLPVIALYVFAGYRLMPAIQQIWGAVTQIRFADHALENLYADLKSLDLPRPNHQVRPFSFTNSIQLEGVTYFYPDACKPAINQISLNIPAQSTVGLVGSTGCGKTTAVDLILGLLKPSAGRLLVDGRQVTEDNRKCWQEIIGYVPQDIYLADTTIAANIAFGVSSGEIDQQALERAAKIANLHCFVINELPQKYQTTVGERGVRLSGGQRQRIGIARALYHNPKVLIMDEATSSLDNLTEEAVMEAIHNLGHEMTIVLVAHRLSTVEACDTIYLLEKGEVAARGTFKELMGCSDHFRTLSATSSAQDHTLIS